MDKNKLKALLWKRRLVAKQISALLLSFLVVLSVGLPVCLLGLTSAQVGSGEGEVGVSLVPLLDKYGQPAVNADGTFYPNDKFELSYSAAFVSGVVFEKVEVSYDSLVFNLFDCSSDFGAEVGWGSFEVFPSAPAGVYSFCFSAWGSRFSASDNTTTSVVVESVFSVEVVEYDPHFTVALTYTVPAGSGSSYDKPFAIIIRYDGNGPTFNLNQRAIIDDYTWTGYAQKLPDINSDMQQALSPNLTVASFLNQTSNNQFLTQGLTTKTSQPALNVDGKSYPNPELPLTFLWEANTHHTFIWTKILPTTDGSDYVEWFEWQTSLIFPPAINSNLDNQTVSQEDLQNQLLDQINSPNGTLTTTPFGNTITAMYSHNKDIEQIAKNTGISKNQTLQTLTPTPQYFTSQERYAKLQYQLDPKVAKEIINQNFTNSLYYNLTLGCSLFGTPRYFDANFTCEHEYFDKPINATSYKWNPTQQNWTTDNTVNIEATFESALNTTITDILRSTLEEQTTDQTALKMAMTDLYDCGPQTFTGTGTLNNNLKRTSPLYYNLQVTATGQNQQKEVTLQKTVQLNFQTNNPYNLPLNFDPNSPLQVTVLSDSSQNTMLNLNAPTELGGLTNITVYLITNLPTENPNNLQKSQLDLKLLKTLQLTLPQEQIQMSPQHEQFIQYYQGYSNVFEDILGFHDQTQIAVQKDQTTIPLTAQGEALLYVEATNIWGTTFHSIVSIQPYSKPHWNIQLNNITTCLIAIILIAIVISFITYFIKTRQ
ncbi:MAG: hypothetical protein FWB84_06410 [Candidatus Bathyarchaeota archaeon]|uniref:hypothetical protein n=1 Tax=Candidatus Bathycorpusculum sp. TaxID=2994959 RepID=UPI002825C6DE|nr:hypothetical protein [Candidatus Termiticorpusculum sp.]MCL2291733.1 hypothetical protein [Candidatus Termiticorpusculum sp.]